MQGRWSLPLLAVALLNSAESGIQCPMPAVVPRNGTRDDGNPGECPLGPPIALLGIVAVETETARRTTAHWRLERLWNRGCAARVGGGPTPPTPGSEKTSRPSTGDRPWGRSNRSRSPRQRSGG